MVRIKYLFLAALIHPLALAHDRSTVDTQNLPFETPALTPQDKAQELRKKRCIPCEGKVPPLSVEQEDEYAQATPKWTVQREGTHRILRQFFFKDFKGAMKFVNAVADIAEQEHHHPGIEIFFNTVVLELYTHAIHGLSENDFIVASLIDESAQKQHYLGH